MEIHLGRIRRCIAEEEVMNIELLSPAGNMERLYYAIHFGADAVYAGGHQFGLRANAGNFAPEELAQAIKYAHDRQKKIYITLNAYLKDKDTVALQDNICFLRDSGVDAVIVSDPIALITAKKLAPELDVHISTQANVTNSEAARFYYDNGASRIILARELSLEDISELHSKIPKYLELEAFVHGAMCVAYSGRCIMSSALTNRSANEGDCSQPCRWSYRIQESKRDGLWLDVSEDENGTYLLNSTDMMMIRHLSQLADAGVSSFKIEGRMKTIYYAAVTTNAYRMAIDGLKLGEQKFDSRLEDELFKVSHRPYGTGFYFDKAQQTTSSANYVHEYDFVGIVKEKDGTSNDYLIEQRNSFSNGDQLEVVSPGVHFRNICVKNLRNESKEHIGIANHAQQKVYFESDSNLHPMDILRKRRAITQYND